MAACACAHQSKIQAYEEKFVFTYNGLEKILLFDLYAGLSRNAASFRKKRNKNSIEILWRNEGGRNTRTRMLKKSVEEK